MLNRLGFVNHSNSATVFSLLGLLGTVTGMISTFDIITEFGTGDPKIAVEWYFNRLNHHRNRTGGRNTCTSIRKCIVRLG